MKWDPLLDTSCDSRSFGSMWTHRGVCFSCRASTHGLFLDFRRGGEWAKSRHLPKCCAWAYALSAGAIALRKFSIITLEVCNTAISLHSALCTQTLSQSTMSESTACPVLIAPPAPSLAKPLGKGSQQSLPALPGAPMHVVPFHGNPSSGATQRQRELDIPLNWDSP